MHRINAVFPPATSSSQRKMGTGMTLVKTVATERSALLAQSSGSVAPKVLDHRSAWHL
jgi:hypothetical protein